MIEQVIKANSDHIEASAKKQYWQIHVFLLLISLVRAVLDDIWIALFTSWEMMFTNVINCYVYVFVIYLFPLYISFRFLEGFHKYKPSQNAKQKIYRQTAYVWMVYPLVPLISHVADSPALSTVQWFSHIPTFIIERNYFPLGMIVVIPVILLSYVFIIARHTDKSVFQVFTPILFANLILYLLFYQYLYALTLVMLDKYNGIMLFSFATLQYVVFAWPGVKEMEKSFCRSTFKSEPALILVIIGYLSFFTCVWMIVDKELKILKARVFAQEFMLKLQKNKDQIKSPFGGMSGFVTGMHKTDLNHFNIILNEAKTGNELQREIVDNDGFFLFEKLETGKTYILNLCLEGKAVDSVEISLTSQDYWKDKIRLCANKYDCDNKHRN